MATCPSRHIGGMPILYGHRHIRYGHQVDQDMREKVDLSAWLITILIINAS
jgi:hypothetical protein